MSVKTEKQLMRKLTGLASMHQDVMQDMTESGAANYLKHVMGAATLVLGVFPDDDSEYRASTYVIKGNREWQVGMVTGELAGAVDAIPCTDLEQAMAFKRAYGDGQIKSDA
jgi:hypothetical protein